MEDPILLCHTWRTISTWGFSSPNSEKISCPTNSGINTTAVASSGVGNFSCWKSWSIVGCVWLLSCYLVVKHHEPPRKAYMNHQLPVLSTTSCVPYDSYDRWWPHLGIHTNKPPWNIFQSSGMTQLWWPLLLSAASQRLAQSRPQWRCRQASKFMVNCDEWWFKDG